MPTKFPLPLHTFLRNLLNLALYDLMNLLLCKFAAPGEAIQEPGQFHSEASVRITVPDARLPVLLGETKKNPKGSLILLYFTD
jgi:hypothetical protein